MNERKLAYVVKIDNVIDIDGVNNQVAIVGGWNVFVKRDEFKPGDLAVYFEIDSKVPELPVFEFLKKYNYHIKTQKFVKGKVISQGLLCRFEDLNIKHYSIDTDLTNVLGVTYYNSADNDRKGVVKAKTKVGKYFMRYAWFRAFKRFINGVKGNKTFPVWVKKTDETRIQNMTSMFWDKEGKLTASARNTWIITEKIDGMSATYCLKGNKFLCCSRNYVVIDKDTPYVVIAERYKIKDVLSALKKKYKAKSIVLQGEIYGKGIQSRDYSLSGYDFAAFNLIIDGQKFNTAYISSLLEPFNIKSVPIIKRLAPNEFPKSCKEFLEMADGKSLIDNKSREGFVVRSVDNKISFKVVSNKYLLEKGE